MSYEMIITHCAPTLAGLKIGNLFSCPYTNEQELKGQIELNNALLNRKGIYFCILKKTNNMALIYVYRPSLLSQILTNTKIQDFLMLYNYNNFSLDACLTLLERNLTLSDFPHEIGIFLGYPLADVKAFIKYKGHNYKHLGYWKVYSNLAETLKTFEKFNKCTCIYLEKYALGYDINRLTVAG